MTAFTFEHGRSTEPLSRALRRPAPIIIVAVGAIIAALTPFDRALGLATFGSPILRVVLLVVLAGVGLALANRIGAPIESQGLRHPIVTPLLAGAGMALYVAAIDFWVFGSSIDPAYYDFMAHQPLSTRLGLLGLRAFNESILYRLFLATLLVWALGFFWRRADGSPANGAYWTAIVVSQAANIVINVTLLHGPSLGPMILLHDVLRYIVPGVVWGYLYFRNGFQTHEIAAVGTHIFLQPLLSIIVAG